MTRIALIGNPNSGKTTVFNALTGTHQRVGNWPGVTVERKTGHYHHAGGEVEVVDLPGTYSLRAAGDAIDELIARQYIAGEEAEILVNVLDATTLRRGLYLTRELLEHQIPVIVALNMMDAAKSAGLDIDVDTLSEHLGCPVIPLIASRSEGIDVLRDAIATPPLPPSPTDATSDDPRRVYSEIDTLVNACVSEHETERSLTDRIDAIVLNRYLAFPLFLGAMYLMFMFSINVGSAFIDFFDLTAQALFVEIPRIAFQWLSLPQWLVVFLADGVGGGIQLVATFIPVIGCLLLALAFLEDSGYMVRVAFIIDRLMRAMGLPGKCFVPLIVGFGCNVPAVMATRTLDNQPDRILTTIMAPYMSCGARLTVYALFAAAFFPSNGQNVVFALYLIGIAVAVLSALVTRRFLIASEPGVFLMELPSYHRPTFRGLVTHAWQRLRGFVERAGKAIVAVVVVINVMNSIGSDGSVGNEDTDKSILAAIGKTITPAFAPMGIDEDNWPATVGIFTGVFAKEVVVGTLDALYSPVQQEEAITISGLLGEALASVPANLTDLSAQLSDPLGLSAVEFEDVADAAEEQEVAIDTIGVMQQLFHGELGAFSYLLFILLYMPCVATAGAIYKEIGAFWAVFSTTWSLVMAYAVAVICYQAGILATSTSDPLTAGLTLLAALALAALCFTALILWGRRKAPIDLIPVIQVD
ncbi:MAG: ferrous iron transport protein B [Pseudomonadales bacterium]|nr:ferrous iron transport protein B [Pseudomonadales bacterium]MDP6471847.1 ferrous iron transport protein B [Pseudomonadales bacterium]MDP6826883.1 ferrous iron transport protein B [Pseudomonadales bacterium]MDP6970839.1 ferrous iron transport protein B [Pseudomonadales bacterium]